MNLPSQFIEQIRALISNDEYTNFVSSLQKPSPVSIRMNHAKQTDVLLKEENGVPWCSQGYYLNQRLTFTFDPLFHAGCYYVQEASSMFLEQVIRQYVSQPSNVLDLCAAPGGKSTHLRSLLPENSLLVTNEVIRTRSHILSENMIKWGHPDIVVTNNDPSDFSSLRAFFDVILADVPCSGEGMFRKDPDAMNEWSPGNVEICRQRQRRIVADVWSGLKPGGLFIYSTCTYNTKENEENIAWIRDQLGAEVLSLDIPGEWNVTGNLLNGEFPVYRFFPHKVKGEGFFLAVLRKSQHEVTSGLSLKNKDKKDKVVLPSGWLKDADKFQPVSDAGYISAIPTQFMNEVVTLKKHLKVMQAGITLGEVKGKDIIPSHSLAMSYELNKDAFPITEVTFEQAISYLRKEAITLDINTPKGYVLLTYKKVPLGFVKNIGNRANNLYPGEWRIKSGYLPEEIRAL